MDRTQSPKVQASSHPLHPEKDPKAHLALVKARYRPELVETHPSEPDFPTGLATGSSSLTSEPSKKNDVRSIRQETNMPDGSEQTTVDSRIETIMSGISTL